VARWSRRPTAGSGPGPAAWQLSTRRRGLRRLRRLLVGI